MVTGDGEVCQKWTFRTFYANVDVEPDILVSLLWIFILSSHHIRGWQHLPRTLKKDQDFLMSLLPYFFSYCCSHWSGKNQPLCPQGLPSCACRFGLGTFWVPWVFCFSFALEEGTKFMLFRCSKRLEGKTFVSTLIVINHCCLFQWSSSGLALFENSCASSIHPVWSKRGLESHLYPTQNRCFSVTACVPGAFLHRKRTTT